MRSSPMRGSVGEQIAECTPSPHSTAMMSCYRGTSAANHPKSQLPSSKARMPFTHHMQHEFNMILDSSPFKPTSDNLAIVVTPLPHPTANRFASTLSRNGLSNLARGPLLMTPERRPDVMLIRRLPGPGGLMLKASSFIRGSHGEAQSQCFSRPSQQISGRGSP